MASLLALNALYLCLIIRPPRFQYPAPSTGIRPPIGRLIAAIGVPGTRVTSVNRSIISERKPFLDALEERIWKRLVPWCTGATDQWNAQTCQTYYMNDRQYEIPTEIAFASKARIETTLFEAKMHLSIDRKYVGHAECPSIHCRWDNDARDS